MDIKAKLRYTAFLSLLFFLSSAVPIFAEPPREITSETGVYYTVKKGDTLWGLSKKFSDDPFTWPDLWSKNNQLANPHRIYPGQKIKLIRRRDTDSRPVEPPLIEVKKRPRYYNYSKIERVGFMKKEPITPHGRVFKLHGTKRIMLGTGDTIYIEENPKNPLIIGARYTTYRTFSPADITEKLLNMDRKKLSQLRHEIGIQHYLSGTVDIISKKNDFFIARITTAYRAIKLNDKLMPYKKRSSSILLREGAPSMEGEIIIAEGGETTFGQDMTGFINRGSRDGILKGQTYEVYYYENKESEAFFGGKNLRIPVTIGTILIIEPQEKTASVLITYATQGLTPGDAFKSMEYIKK